MPKRFPDDGHDAVHAEPRVARAAIAAAAADAAVRERVRGSAFRPHDIATAQVEPAALLFVPFYRVRVAIDGFHVGLSGASVRLRGATIPIPSGGARHVEQDVGARAASSPSTTPRPCGRSWRARKLLWD